MEVTATRKVLKADREKLRRDKLNEQFLELGNLLDPDRPKNDKATIVSDTIQVLKDLNSEVKRLKKEHTLLCEESHELTQEKNEIRDEKASLKSNIQNLRAQQQQQQPTQGFMVPWDPQLVMAPSYPFPVAVSMHQATQAPPSFANQHQFPCSTYIPYIAPAMPRATALNVTVSRPTASSRSGTANSNDVATDLELKIPGSKVGFLFSTTRCDVKQKFLSVLQNYAGIVSQETVAQTRSRLISVYG
ncbi:basic helix-loop-helix transcription factor [Salvia divinorum]|uniref:Basic helix-loop-helix transcription factor n=1 Tax=Salvia divinorum TaxID=28513 RepID=A0ABD1IM07_SALDI